MDQRLRWRAWLRIGRILPDSLAGVKVLRLSVTPVKGLTLHHPDSVRLDASGAVGDRDFCLADERGKLVSVTRSGGLLGLRAEHDDERLTLRDDAAERTAPVTLGDPLSVDLEGYRYMPGRIVPGPWDALLAERAGRPVRAGPGRPPGRWLRRAARHHPRVARPSRNSSATPGAPIDPRRFRMLIDLETDMPHVEDTWAGGASAARGRVRGLGPRPALRRHHPSPRARRARPPAGEGDQGLPRLRETEIGPGVPFGVYAQRHDARHAARRRDPPDMTTSGGCGRAACASGRAPPACPRPAR